MDNVNLFICLFFYLADMVLSLLPLRSKMYSQEPDWQVKVVLDTAITLPVYELLRVLILRPFMSKIYTHDPLSDTKKSCPQPTTSPTYDLLRVVTFLPFSSQMKCHELSDLIKEILSCAYKPHPKKKQNKSVAICFIVWVVLLYKQMQ